MAIDERMIDDEQDVVEHGSFSKGAAATYERRPKFGNLRRAQHCLG
jgi:hypothetical protein